MGKALVGPIVKTLVASAEYSASGATAAFSIGVCDTYDICIVTASVSGTTPTADVVLQTSVDGGSTYVNLPIRTTQITAAGTDHLVFRLGLGGNEVALESPAAATGGTLAKNCVFDPAFMKLYWTIGGSTPVVTATVFLLATQPGSQQGQ